MATASVSKLDYGYQVTGDSVATTISGADGYLRVKAFYFTGTSCTITSLSDGDYFSGGKEAVGSACSAFDIPSPGLYYLGEGGVLFRNLTVTTSDVPDILCIMLKGK